MSYELKIDPKKRAAARFMGKVRKALINAAMDEKEQTGLTQQAVAERLGVHRSVITRLLKNESNLTLRSVAELAWALDYVPQFSLERRERAERRNNVAIPAHAEPEHRAAIKPTARPNVYYSGESSSTSSKINNRVLEGSD